MSIVQAGYRHLTKAIEPAAAIDRSAASALKWYDIAPADEPVPARSGRSPAAASAGPSTRARSLSTTTSAS